MLVVAWASANENPTGIDTLLVLAGAILRNTSADQRANQTPSRAARAQTCQRGGQRTGDNQTEAGDHDRSADGEQRPEGRTDPPPIAPPFPMPSAALVPPESSVPGLTSPKCRLRVSSDIITLMSSGL